MGCRSQASRVHERKVKDILGRPPLRSTTTLQTDNATSMQADVHDHMEYILMSLDMFAGVSDNLINYTCNVRLHLLPRLGMQLTASQMVSYEMNEGM